MSNIVLLISNAYEEFQNGTSNTNTNNASNNKWLIYYNKVKDVGRKNKILVLLLITLIISVMIFGLSITLNWNMIIIGCSFIFYSLDMFIIATIVDKRIVKNYSKHKEDYYNKMDNFKLNILDNEFSIDSKSKVEQLIEECDNTCKELKESRKIIKNPSDLWKSIIVPIFTFYIGIIFNIDSISKQISLEIVAQGTVLAILFLGMIIGVYMIIKPILAIIINVDSNRVKRLRNVLNDIFLIYYI